MGTAEIGARAQASGARCECGHAAPRHELAGFDGECVADGCRCTDYTPRLTGPVEPVALGWSPVRVNRSGIEQLIDQGKRSQSKRTRALVARLEAEVTDLYSRLRAERAMVAAQAAAASARTVVDAPLAAVVPLPAEDLDDKPERRPHGTRGQKLPRDKNCELCGQGGLANVGVHRRIKHGIRAAS